MSLNVQFVTMGYMFLSGVALGVLYDVYRVVAGLLRISRWIIPLLDLIYWVAATLLVFRVLYYSNQGQVRAFVFLALLIGISFYFALLSRWVILLLHWLIRVTKAFIRLCKRMGEILIVKPIIALYRAFIIFLGFLAALSVFLYKVVLQLLYPLWFIVRPLVRWLRRAIKVPPWLSRTVHKLKNWLKRIFDLF